MLRVRGAAPEARDAAAAALIEAGAGGVQEEGDALVTYLESDRDLAGLRTRLGTLAPDATLEATELGEVDWSRQWAPRVGVQRLGRLTVAPPWLADEAGADAIVIDPAMAFGTGEHATTRGVLRLMQDVIRPGDVVADLGAGSAVLSIAAVRLGAARVAAVELDPHAITNAEENVERNGVADRVRVIEGDATLLLPLLAPVRVILANMFSSVLTQLAPAMRRALTADGRAIVSGILLDERERLLAGLAVDGWRLEGDDREGEWWSAVLAHR